MKKLLLVIFLSTPLFTEVKDSEHYRRVLWSYEGGSEEEYSGVMTGGMGMEEEKMLVLFKKVLVDLVDNL